MPACLAALTPAEAEVARLASGGAQNSQIARLRRVSTRTVANQMSSVLGKLGIVSRVSLATLPELTHPPGAQGLEGPVEGQGQRTVDWSALTRTEREILVRASNGRAQKEIAFECGLNPSTVSRAMRAVRQRLGFDSFAALVRAYAVG